MTEIDEKPRPSIHAYNITLTCRDCGVSYSNGDKRPNQTVNEVLTQSGERMVGILIWAPARCPRCHNLRALPND